MGGSAKEQQHEVEEDEEEYVLLDLDGVAPHIRIPENAAYVLTGLDTLNPILVIDNNIKLIGEYTETIGTGLIFGESDAGREQEAGPSEAKKTQAKQVNPTGQLTKVLKFKLCLEPTSKDLLNHNGCRD
ncbi:uncharacterized protein LOC125223571 [Salvia hispanica]|uniref:uncharacterized protein LOC125223571 n=1 Tax=Salvia hispanica TaxID=49212 RepID=UPI002009D782|nr:uncharacterized protein LOC125223571 [Salvia hispanica]XP_047982732.1 uncharacterized protein LOC125223571 [Salvia hispanica]